MNAEELQNVLEVINGDWAILSGGLMIVCLSYLYHELVARRLRVTWRRRWTKGMRVAAAIATLSAGICITRLTIYLWRHLYKGADFSNLQLAFLIFGAAVGALGILCAMREISRPLYGNRPWVITLIVLVLATVVMVIDKFF